MTLAKNRGAGLDDRIMTAARELAQAKPLDHIGLSEIARRSGVSWPTVKRHVGSKAALRARLVDEQPELVRNVRDTKTRLLDAAARVFARQGYESATLDSVASEAGLTKGAVYWHFESKGHLFRALLREYEQRERDFSAQQVKKAAGAVSAEEAVLAVLTAELERVAETPEWARLPVEFVAAGRDPDIGADLASALRQRRDVLIEIIRELQAAARAKEEIDAEAAALLLSAVLRGLTELLLIEPELDIERALPRLARMIAHGLAVPDADAR
ncbi:MAG TPA: helix-turn-helix domain-containing protein [Polyangiaceae bacterium]|nr:helix-turn-helix domain-containing protein [Polyangiaceae bacterium]